ncbi:Zinc-binding oxidoreductase [Phaffia rhodozyma]|uniref:Zinc-binding oxidoreductase n=1 Tax=Phaffia rhodozyma TaxID=264483 RepID=A0A0F7SIC5_PHARH|nr:Zinc-binding oxidoreductase [Phaffia rhodozyma]
MSTSSLPKTYSHYYLENRGTFDSIKFKQDVPLKAPGLNQVLIRVRAVSLNYRDLIIAKDQYPLSAVPERVIPASDGAGDVVAVGDGVSNWKAGDRVMATFTLDHQNGYFDEASFLDSTIGGAIDGMLAEYVIMPTSGLVRVPEHLTYEEAATLPCAALTAWNALFGTDGSVALKPGQSVLLEGTGGVSCFGAQFALMAGARAIITSSSDEKLGQVAEAVKTLGGSRLETINYKTTPEWDEEVLKKTGNQGVAHVLEVGGQGTIEKAFSCLKQGGVVSCIGFLAKPGDMPPNVALLALVKGAVFRGFLVGSRRQFEQMCDAISLHKMRPIVGKVFEYKDARAAYEFQAGQTGFVGKVVIKVSN